MDASAVPTLARPPAAHLVRVNVACARWCGVNEHRACPAETLARQGVSAVLGYQQVFSARGATRKLS